jgi:hypothetical protein
VLRCLPNPAGPSGGEALYDGLVQRIPALLLPLLVLACGGDDDGAQPGDPIGPAGAEEVCGQFGDHAADCGWGGNVNQADWNCGEAAMVWREDVFREFAACATELPCDGDGASCYQILDDAAPLAIHDDYAASCQDRTAACDLSADSDTSTLLLSCSADSLAAYADPVVESVIACFDQPCADVVACLDDIL